MSLLKKVDMELSYSGGEGAIRELAEKILISKDNLSDFYKDKDLQGYKDFYKKNYPTI